MCIGVEKAAKLAGILSCVQQCVSFLKESPSSVKGLDSTIKCLQKEGRRGQEDAETAEHFLLSVIHKSSKFSFVERSGHPHVLDLTKA